MDSNATDSLIRVESFLSNNLDFQNGSEEVAVMFVDLVGSTEFKRDFGGLAGLAKTVQHNKTASEQIIAHGGIVVKYIGDAVMGMFRGKNARAQAFRVGIQTIVSIDQANIRHGWRFPFAMSTKIGMDAGTVWMFNFPESTTPDPQGPTVDLAARLASIAAHQQLVCTEDFYQKAHTGIEHNPSGVVKRYVKGIPELQQLRFIVPSGWSFPDGHLDGVPGPLNNGLADGMKLLRAGNRAEAIKRFQEVLAREPGSFHANYFLAALLIPQAKSSKELEAAMHYACSAKWARPTSSKVWLLISKLRARQYQITRDEESLGQAIRNAETACRCADDNLEFESAFEAKELIARYLLERMKIFESKGMRSEADQDLAAATGLCNEAHARLEKTAIRYRAEFCVTRAFVLMALKRFDEAGEAIEEALSMNKECARAHEARVHLLTIHNPGDDFAA